MAGGASGPAAPEPAREPPRVCAPPYAPPVARDTERYAGKVTSSTAAERVRPPSRSKAGSAHVFVYSARPDRRCRAKSRNWQGNDRRDSIQLKTHPERRSARPRALALLHQDIAMEHLPDRPDHA